MFYANFFSFLRYVVIREFLKTRVRRSPNFRCDHCAGSGRRRWVRPWRASADATAVVVVLVVPDAAIGQWPDGWDGCPSDCPTSSNPDSTKMNCYGDCTKKLHHFTNTEKKYVIKTTLIINTRCQFHRHFMQDFCNDIFPPKKFKPKTQPCNFWHQNFVRKMGA